MIKSHLMPIFDYFVLFQVSIILIAHYVDFSNYPVSGITRFLSMIPNIRGQILGNTHDIIVGVLFCILDPY
jgi:hypothetical protein